MTDTILVTGGAGFIGHHLVQALVQRGNQVIVLDDLSMGIASRIPKQARLIVGDVRDNALVAEICSQVDIICHLAAKVSVRASIDNFFEDADINMMGTLNLLGHCHHSPVRRFLLASSMAVYAESGAGQTVDEEHPTAPLSPYGQAKLTAEYYVRTIADHLGIDWFNLRLFNTYGEGQRLTPYVGVITIFADRLAKNLAPIIFGDGEQRRDFVHVSDIVRGWLAAIDASPSASGTYNIGTGQALTVNRLADMIGDILGKRITPIYEAARTTELRNSVANIEAARNRLGYEPHAFIEQALAETIAILSAEAAEE